MFGGVIFSFAKMRPLTPLLVVVAGLVLLLGVISTVSSEKRMVCYYGAWAVYRPGRGKFVVEDIDPNLCTHIVYGFAKLEDNQIQSFDPWEDLQDGGGKGGYLRFTGLKKKNPKLKAILAIGGWNEGSEKYSDMASSPKTRKMFVDSVIPFLQKYKFDGLDLDWEYPTTRGGKPEDKENFSLLVKELRKALGSRYLLTAAVSPNIETVAEAYDIAVISKNLDFISVMCYDYHGAWEGHPFTGHNTPLYQGPKDLKYIPHFNANETLTYWIDGGLPREKVNMGMALYGRGFTLDDPNRHGLYAPAKEGIPMGPYTRQDGTWGYNEICEVFKSEGRDWKIVIDPYIQAPYAYNENRWIGYDDVESLYIKSKYALDMELGGAMVWSIETDDFRGYCHNQKYLLIHTIRKTMDGGGKPQIPQRPQIVQAQDDDDDNSVIPTTAEPEDELTTTRMPTRRTRPSRRTTAAAVTQPPPEDYDEPTTQTPTKRTRPPRRTTMPAPTTTPEDLGDYEDESTTTRRTRKPRRTTTPISIDSENEIVPAPSPSTIPPSPPSNGGECPSDGVHPNGSDCQSFLICQDIGGGRYRKHVQKCPHGLVFDPQVKGCDYPDRVPSCSRYNMVSLFYRKTNPHV